jgi:hypothetical protein
MVCDLYNEINWNKMKWIIESEKPERFMGLEVHQDNGKKANPLE